MSGRGWRCFCGATVLPGALQDHLIDHERERARSAGEGFVWFDDTHGCCASCGAGVSRARCHLHRC